MKFGIKTPPQHCSWQDMLDVWKATDEVEVFSSCWNFDHFYPLVGDPEGPCMEAWVTLTALAANTRRVRDLNAIECSVQIALPADQDPNESAAQAAALGEAGVDTVLFSLRNPYRASIIEPLGRALEAL